MSLSMSLEELHHSDDSVKKCLAAQLGAKKLNFDLAIRLHESVLANLI